MVRKICLWTLGLMVVALVGLACGEEASPTPAGTATTTTPTTTATPVPTPTATPVSMQTPIKIGVLHALTGALGGLGQDMTNGFTAYFQSINNEVAGRPLQIIVEDTESQANVGLDKARKLVERDKVDILAGPISSAVALAIADYVKSVDVPLFITQASVESLTQEDRDPYIFRTAYTSDQQYRPIGQWLVENRDYKKAVVIAQDYVAGHEHAQGFIDSFVAAGGEVVQEQYPKLGETSYLPYIPSIKTKPDADVVVPLLWGAASVPFMNQAHEFGLTEDMPIFGLGTLNEDGIYLPNIQPQAADGSESVLTYCLCLDTPANQEFVRAYNSIKGTNPNYHIAFGWVAAQAIAQAIADANGDVEDKEAFIKAAEGVQFESPMGPFRFDAHHNPYINDFIRKVEIDPATGQARNVLVDTIEGIGQYWPQDVSSFDEDPPS